MRLGEFSATACIFRVSPDIRIMDIRRGFKLGRKTSCAILVAFSFTTEAYDRGSLHAPLRRHSTPKPSARPDRRGDWVERSLLRVGGGRQTSPNSAARSTGLPRKQKGLEGTFCLACKAERHVRLPCGVVFQVTEIHDGEVRSQSPLHPKSSRCSTLHPRADLRRHMSARGKRCSAPTFCLTM